ncbi:Transcription regulator [Fasciola hepatica]|uniref:Transcription regulator n=1 Tax=Fasciola hepatica TaxID=6192 RepID=A0A4E0R1Q3_FASHE|nr:Transcription regulator [Fasciola hepatica]
MSEGTIESQQELVNKPKDSSFHQQRLPAWRPILTARFVFPIFLVIGILFIPIGIVLLVFERVIEYTHCERSDANNTSSFRVLCSEEVRKPSFFSQYSSCPCQQSFSLDSDLKGDVYFYYGLSNFYQNHRRYVMSKDDMQLHGDSNPLSAACDPFRTNPEGKSYAPCGAIAMSLFNDTFQLMYNGQNSAPLSPPVNVPLTNRGIAWRTDVEQKFGKPSASIWANTVKPDSWPRTALERSPNAYSGDEELIVWMRVAALPTFRKLHRILVAQDRFSEGLPAGNYTVNIGYAYPVTQFGGTKRFIISTSSWLGGRNPTLGIAYLVMGSISLLLGLLFLGLHYRFPRRVGTTLRS